MVGLTLRQVECKVQSMSEMNAKDGSRQLHHKIRIVGVGAHHRLPVSIASNIVRSTKWIRASLSYSRLSRDALSMNQDFGKRELVGMTI